jgi:Na+-transporting methylmalonyl-CoA/oxaloacetate decarboxylase gamma subunit
MLAPAASLPDWLTAIGGVGAFLATSVLAVVATKQMGKLERQAQAAQDQVRAAQEQVNLMRQTARDDARAVTDQVAASIAQSEAIRDAARVFVQPRVLGYPAGAASRGPDPYGDIGEGEIGFPYRIVNEGGGLALNVQHGIELEGEDYLFGGGMETAALGAGFSSPPPDSDLGGFRPLFVVVREDVLVASWPRRPVRYLARFTNVLGERYETRTPADPTQSHTFKQIESSRE